MDIVPGGQGGELVQTFADLSIISTEATLGDFITLTDQLWKERGHQRVVSDRTSLLSTWQESPYYHQAAQQISRALRAGQAYSLTGGQWQETLRFFHGQCAYCGKSFDLFEMDHVFPHQGGGGFTIGNIVPSCMKCNRRKKDKGLEECLNLGYIGFEVYSKVMKWQDLQRR